MQRPHARLQHGRMSARFVGDELPKLNSGARLRSLGASPGLLLGLVCALTGAVEEVPTHATRPSSAAQPHERMLCTRRAAQA